VTKSEYMICSHQGKFGVCLVQESMNEHRADHLYKKYQVGDEVDVKSVPNTNENKDHI